MRIALAAQRPRCGPAARPPSTVVLELLEPRPGRVRRAIAVDEVLAAIIAELDGGRSSRRGRPWWRSPSCSG
jgi:hypothetical protein